MSHGSAEPTEVFALSRRTSSSALLAAAGFVAVGAVLILIGWSDLSGVTLRLGDLELTGGRAGPSPLVLGVVGVVAALFGGTAGAFHARRLLQRDRTALVLDTVGFVDRASLSGAGPVAWDETVGIRIVDHPARTLVVEVVDPDAVAERQPSAARRQAARANIRQLGSPVCIPLSAVGRREDELLEAFERLGHLRPGFYRGTPSST
ncbi:STM3941 family protein [Isoptericola sp. NPDC056605]|uniref:STM3941 family protein n=1 Tax=Isoptericola sp. NPDC056605 TaxID=3345876 RepID=UPI0036D09197